MFFPSTLVLGGNGRLAAALRGHLPDSTIYVARSAPEQGTVSVGDYAATPPSLFKNVETVINCAGVTAADPALMQRANIETPLFLARLARTAGVRRFVHVSSFSVFGRAARIDADTPIDPVTPYGKSKRAAEQGLMALKGDGFAPACVRLPAIVGGGPRDKLRRLIGLWLRLRRLPIPRTPVLRSMISVGLSARVLADIAAGDDAGIFHAADSRPFTYQEAAVAVSRGARRQAGLLTLPDAMFQPLENWAPGLFVSLYEHSLLEPELNRAAVLSSDLYETITRMAREEMTS